ncbi:lytic transglycosylase [Leptospira perolatii]|uniref:Lytic transglycosylase n=1 Tax=Leptospira perolatii TaxID=2023191 RepID=A0A2M9ZPJ4_9LEPT|nr:lytic transglycosylase domain-containing protein [Leptospira perolatii]PJZ70778.1 lytic transglycosylase [Leptospira perolatii]PJZ73986.1 lytic transglycosylase [Leptospira perolatii]
MKLSDLDSFRTLISRIEEIRSLSERMGGKSGQLEGTPPRAESISFSDLLNSRGNARDARGELAPRELSELISEQSLKNGLDPDLVSSVIRAESNFKRNAVSEKGAMGYMQLMPKTADLLGVEDPFDPEENISAGTKFLGDLVKRFGDTNLGLAAYNAGPGAVEKYKGVPPFRETKDYVQKVNRYWKGG